MADQAVCGVHSLVSEQARQSAQQKPEGRGHHPIVETLSEAFQGRGGDTAFIQTLHVTANDPRDRAAG